MPHKDTENWEDVMPAWVFKLSKRRFAQLGRAHLSLLSSTRTKTLEEVEAVLPGQKMWDGHPDQNDALIRFGYNSYCTKALSAIEGLKK